MPVVILSKAYCVLYLGNSACSHALFYTSFNQQITTLVIQIHVAMCKYLYVCMAVVDGLLTGCTNIRGMDSYYTSDPSYIPSSDIVYV